jgi:SAM-dependent methyltransferase
MKWTEKRHYDVLEAGVWKHLHKVRVSWILEQVRHERQRHTGAFRILDVGCGDGVITKRLRVAFPDVRVTAVDLDEVRLRRATAYCPRVAFCQSTVETLPFAQETFQLVLCHHVVEHVPNDVRLLEECGRVLSPTGLFILGLPHEGGIIGKILRTLHRRLYAAGEHINFYTIANMRRLLTDAGFKDITYAKFGFLFPHYYLHVALVWNKLTFAIGHRITQWFDVTADSLIFAARKTNPEPAARS